MKGVKEGKLKATAVKKEKGVKGRGKRVKRIVRGMKEGEY